MVTISFVFGRSTNTPISVIIQEETAAVAMDHLDTVLLGFLSARDKATEEPGNGSEGSGPGFGPGSFSIN